MASKKDIVVYNSEEPLLTAFLSSTGFLVRASSSDIFARQAQSLENEPY